MFAGQPQLVPQTIPQQQSYQQVMTAGRVAPWGMGMQHTVELISLLDLFTVLFLCPLTWTAQHPAHPSRQEVFGERTQERQGRGMELGTLDS